MSLIFKKGILNPLSNDETAVIATTATYLIKIVNASGSDVDVAVSFDWYEV